MTPVERAGIVCSLLNFKPISRQDADNFDAVVKEIEEGEREAFNAAKEKAAEIADEIDVACDCSELPFVSEVAEQIRAMEPDK